LGFQVAGWSRNAKSFDGIESFHGPDGLEPFLERTNILVCLLPLTPDTRHLLNRRIFSLLDRNSPLGAPVLINAGRGGLQVEADILASLNDGTLGAASLDVFETEPLPKESPLWSHPKVIVTPHNAADTDPEEISKYVAGQIEQFEAGKKLHYVVDRTRGY
jgi:glyoxylate/hydroxypyruvate reductase A